MYRIESKENEVRIDLDSCRVFADGFPREELIVKNPFTPSFGRVPAVMAGREIAIDEIIGALEDAPDDPCLSSIFIGPRGTGKTAMLACLGRRAEEEGWIAVNVTSSEGMLEDVIQQARRRASHLIDTSSRREVVAVSVAHVGGVQFDGAEKEKLNWRSRMTELVEKLGEHEVGLMIGVDEVDPDLPEMSQLVSVYQHFVMEGRRVALMMAGLPDKVSSLINGKSVSFLRRASRRWLGLVPDYEVRAAFVDTFALSGKTVESDALDEMVKMTSGYPYMLQLVGYRSWNESKNDGMVRLPAVQAGGAMAKEDFRERVLNATLDELSPKDLKFLAAMLEDDEFSAQRDIAKRLDPGTSAKTPSVSAYKKRLVERGLIEDKGRGNLRFALPMLREYLPEYLDNERLV